MKSKLLFVFTLVCLPLFARPSSANIARRVSVSAGVLEARMESIAYIPKFILDEAQCIATLRSVKAGFIFGGEGSTGMVSCRLNNGEWSAPSFFNAGGASFGLLIGGQVVDSVLVFMTSSARSSLNHAQLSLGTELSFAVGPVGEGASISAIPNAEVLTYSAGTGLYAGFSLNGLVMSHGLARNAEVYGRNVTPRQLLMTPGSKAPEVVQPFIEVLNQYASR